MKLSKIFILGALLLSLLGCAPKQNPAMVIYREAVSEETVAMQYNWEQKEELSKFLKVVEQGKKVEFDTTAAPDWIIEAKNGIGDPSTLFAVWAEAPDSLVFYCTDTGKGETVAPQRATGEAVTAFLSSLPSDMD